MRAVGKRRLDTKLSRCLVCGLLMLCLVGCQKTAAPREAEQTATTAEKLPETANYWIITDPHFLADELHDDGEAFAFIEKTAAGKDLQYQTAGLQALVAAAAAEKPTGIIVTGDLTLNGEKASIEQLEEIFQPLLAAGIEIYMLPWNHDIYDGWARKYHGEQQERIQQISPTDFKMVFSEMGYQGAHEQDAASLSYRVAITDYLDFYFLDTNKYGQAEATRGPETSGRLAAETWDWLKEEMAQTQAAGKQALVFMHHNLYQHNSLVYEGYVIDEAAELAAYFQEGPVAAVFSGHIHAQDILVEEGLPEIVTGSYGITPKPYGVLTINKTGWTYQQRQIDVAQWAQSQGESNRDLLNYGAYLDELFLRDGRQMAYRNLFEAGLPDEPATDEAAALVGQLNRDFFIGADDRSAEEVAEIKESTAYQTLKEHAVFLAEYVDSIIQDEGTADRYYQQSWSVPE